MSTFSKNSLSVISATCLMFFYAAALANVGSMGSSSVTGNKTTQSQGLVRPSYRSISLQDAATLTAQFNESTRDVGLYPPNLPFQMLYVPPTDMSPNNTPGGVGVHFIVGPGTWLYVPLMYNNDVPPVLGGALPPVGDQSGLLRYFYSPNLLGLQLAKIIVDGHETSLGPKYIAEVSFDPALPDGTTLYQTIAGFVPPLPSGDHTVETMFLFTGEAIHPVFGPFWFFDQTYNVTVQ